VVALTLVHAVYNGTSVMLHYVFVVVGAGNCAVSVWVNVVNSTCGVSAPTKVAPPPLSSADVL